MFKLLLSLKMDSQNKQSSRPKSSDQDFDASMDCLKPVSKKVLEKQLGPADKVQNKTETTSSVGSEYISKNSKI